MKKTYNMSETMTRAWAIRKAAAGARCLKS